jgi:aerobic-type carbon monoxide dehydrogenase small subunit (CoxS/CutS family)
MIKVSKNELAEVSLTINGKMVKERVEPRKLLSDFLREECGLTGTHVGCEHGVCGACTVLINGSAIRSCLMFAVQTEGDDIKTVEGLAKGGKPDSLQEAFSECHALQCGFCTPGILMSAVDFLNSNSDPTKNDIKEMLSGHLCRCTGYKGIIEAIEKEAYRRKDGENINGSGDTI